jgi:predicted nicotinamide N-methyase
VLELGAGTGLLGILCRKLLDLRMTSPEISEERYPGLVVATDFHHDVLSNLKVCVDLNFPPHMPTSFDVINGAATVKSLDDGVKIAKLDWTTFPAYMEARMRGESVNEEENEDIGHWVGEPFDLVLASDCVYDPTHAAMLREVASWVLRLPDESVPGDIGGTYVSHCSCYNGQELSVLSD